MDQEAEKPYIFSGKFPADSPERRATTTHYLHDHRHTDDELQEYLKSI